MKEQEWLACDDSTPMLEFIVGQASDRKLRLFACACTRAVRELLWVNFYSKLALQRAEEYAEGKGTPEDLLAAQNDVRDRLELYGAEPIYDASFWACGPNIAEDLSECAFYAANTSMKLIQDEIEAYRVRAEAVRQQSHFLRDVLGPVLFRSILLDPRWRTSTVVGLAEAIYADRAFDRLPILADALQDAGCEDADILAHCRGDGPHVRGCWVVDLVLGKQ